MAGMVGDFSEPQKFAPKLFDVGKILDPDSEGYEIDFKQWKDSQLVVTVEGEDKYISVEEIKKAIGLGFSHPFTCKSD